MEIVKFIVPSWSHHHYKQFEGWPLLGASFIQLKSVLLFLPADEKGVIANKDHTCDFVITITYDYWGKQNAKEVWVT